MENSVRIKTMLGSGVTKRHRKPGQKSKIESRQLNKGARATERIIRAGLVERMIRDVLAEKADVINVGHSTRLAKETTLVMRAAVESMLTTLFADGKRLLRVGRGKRITGRHIAFLIGEGGPRSLVRPFTT